MTTTPRPGRVRRRPGADPSWVVVVGLFVLPVLFLASASFHDLRLQHRRLVWGSPRELRALFRSATIIAFGNSLLLSVTATIACLLVGYRSPTRSPSPGRDAEPPARGHHPF